MPIIVGGTMYYTQSILWKSQVLDYVRTTSSSDANDKLSVRLQSLLQYYLVITHGVCCFTPSSLLFSCIQQIKPEDMYLKLQEIDPVMASRLHPNNQRKVCSVLLTAL